MNNHYYYHNNKIFLHSTFPKCGLKMLYTHKSRANVFSRDQIHRTDSFNIILTFSPTHILSQGGKNWSTKEKNN